MIVSCTAALVSCDYCCNTTQLRQFHQLLRWLSRYIVIIVVVVVIIEIIQVTSLSLARRQPAAVTDHQRITTSSSTTVGIRLITISDRFVRFLQPPSKS